jgi:hypothetical protein
MPFRIRCVCGQFSEGVRGPRHHVLPCPGCGASLFVLPRSPLPPSPDEEPAEGLSPPRRRSPWLLPLAAGGLTLAVVAVGLVLALSHLLGPKEDDTDGLEHAPIAEVIETSKKRLAESGFHEAAGCAAIRTGRITWRTTR